jgi:hypothetical protein
MTTAIDVVRVFKAKGIPGIRGLGYTERSAVELSAWAHRALADGRSDEAEPSDIPQRVLPRTRQPWPTPRNVFSDPDAPELTQADISDMAKWMHPTIFRPVNPEAAQELLRTMQDDYRRKQNRENGYRDFDATERKPGQAAKEVERISQ